LSNNSEIINTSASISVHCNAENSEFRADSLAKVAVHAFLLHFDIRGVIPFSVEIIGHFQHAFGAILRTKSATFAAFNDNMDFTSWYMDLVEVKRFAPEFHKKHLSYEISRRIPKKRERSTDARSPRFV
jgi:hypothetical protein